MGPLRSTPQGKKQIYIKNIIILSKEGNFLCFAAPVNRLDVPLISHYILWYFLLVNTQCTWGGLLSLCGAGSVGVRNRSRFQRGAGSSIGGNVAVAGGITSLLESLSLESVPESPSSLEEDWATGDMGSGSCVCGDSSSLIAGDKLEP